MRPVAKNWVAVQNPHTGISENTHTHRLTSCIFTHMHFHGWALPLTSKHKLGNASTHTRGSTHTTMHVNIPYSHSNTCMHTQRHIRTRRFECQTTLAHYGTCWCENATSSISTFTHKEQVQSFHTSPIDYLKIPAFPSYQLYLQITNFSIHAGYRLVRSHVIPIWVCNKQCHHVRC